MSALGQLAQIEFKNTWKYKIMFQKATHHVLFIDIYITKRLQKFTGQVSHQGSPWKYVFVFIICVSMHRKKSENAHKTDELRES